MGLILSREGGRGVGERKEGVRERKEGARIEGGIGEGGETYLTVVVLQMRTTRNISMRMVTTRGPCKDCVGMELLSGR